MNLPMGFVKYPFSYEFIKISTLLCFTMSISCFKTRFTHEMANAEPKWNVFRSIGSFRCNCISYTGYAADGFLRADPKFRLKMGPVGSLNAGPWCSGLSKYNLSETSKWPKIWALRTLEKCNRGLEDLKESPNVFINVIILLWFVWQLKHAYDHISLYKTK